MPKSVLPVHFFTGASPWTWGGRQHPRNVDRDHRFAHCELPPKSYAHDMDDRQDDGLIASTPSSRVIQEYVPGRQVTIANIIANPDRMLCRRVGLETVEAIGMMTITPGESAIIAGDIAVKAADVEIGFLDRFSGTLVITGRLSSVELALEAANRGLQEILGFYPARITRT